MLTVSLLSPEGVRRIAVLGLLGAIVVMAALPFIGDTVKGAARWMNLGPFTLQPSEFVKPGLIVFAAWMFAEGQKGEGVPGVSIAFGFYALAVALLLIQPDVGQTLLITIAFVAVFFMAGRAAAAGSWCWAALAVAGAGRRSISCSPTCAAAREPVPLARRRPTPTRSTAPPRPSRAGGLFGRGVGEGVMKRHVPDLHTDFIYSVGAEEYGLVLSLVLIGLFAFIVVRGLCRAMKLNDPFEQVAAAGLFVLVGLQAFINVAVNLNLIPTKGMTLPFISYGGSSMLAMGLTMGMALALTRRRPGAYEPGASLQRPRRLLMP